MIRISLRGKSKFKEKSKQFGEKEVRVNINKARKEKHAWSTEYFSVRCRKERNPSPCRESNPGCEVTLLAMTLYPNDNTSAVLRTIRYVIFPRNDL
jgi:hypothetical protein